MEPAQAAWSLHPPSWGALALLAPLAARDAALYLLRRRGDRSPERRRALLQHFTEQDLARGRAHTERLNRLFPLSRLLLYLALVALLFCGLGAALEAWCLERCGGSWPLALLLFLALLLLPWALLELPLQAYREFVIQRQAGLSSTTAGLWLADQARGLVLSWVLGAALALPVLGLLRALPGTWPLPAAAAVLAITAFLVWISPWVIAPLFNRFGPLQDQRLDQQLRALVLRAGLRVQRVFVMDASRRSTTLNAYFTGLGGSRRVVLYDTLVDSCTPDEVLSVVAHELGHWRGRHILKGFVLQALATVAGLLLVQQLLWSPTWRALLGLPAPDSMVLLPLLPLLLGYASLLFAPLAAAFSRRHEREADRAALELCEAPAAFVLLEQRLVRRARADLLQHRLIHRWYGSHPLPEERIHAALTYQAKQAT